LAQNAQNERDKVLLLNLVKIEELKFIKKILMNNKYHSGITVKNKLELTQISYARKLKKSNNLCNEVLLNEFISTLEKAIRK